MTPQEAIERLRKIPVRPKPDNALDMQAIIMAVKALENRIPKKVKNIFIENCIKWGQCPCCNNIVNDFVNNKICNNVTCGQALDWSDDK